MKLKFILIEVGTSFHGTRCPIVGSAKVYRDGT